MEFKVGDIIKHNNYEIYFMIVGSDVELKYKRLTRLNIKHIAGEFSGKRDMLVRLDTLQYCYMVVA